MEYAISCSPMRLNDIPLLGGIHTFFHVISCAIQMAPRKDTLSHLRWGSASHATNGRPARGALDRRRAMPCAKGDV